MESIMDNNGEEGCAILKTQNIVIICYFDL